MHELGIASDILDAARSARDASADTSMRVAKIGLRVGALAGVDAEALRFCFEAISRDTEFSATELDIEAASGDELDFKYLEVEEQDGTDHG